MASSSAIRAGRAYVELFTTDNLLVAGLKAAEGKLRAFGAAVAGIGTKFAMLGAAIWAPLIGAAHSFAESGSALLLMSQRTGVSVENLSALSFAAGKTGVNVEDLEGAFAHMTRTLGGAAAGSAEAQKALAAIGFRISDLAGMEPDAQFVSLADAISKLPDETMRGYRAMQIFGRGAAALRPLIMQGVEGINNLVAEAEKVGAIKTTAQAQDARALSLAFQSVERAGKSLFTTIGGAIAPAVTDLARAILPVISYARAWIKENQALWVTLLAVGGAITGLGTALIFLGGAFSFMAVALAPITAVMGVVAAAFNLWLSPIFALVVGIGLIVGALAYFSGALDKVVSVAANRFGFLSEMFSTAWAGIGDAIAAGDWALALEIAGVGLQSAFQGIVTTLRMMWRDFTDKFTSLWDAAVNAVSMGLAGIMETLGLVAEGTVNTMHGMIEQQQRASRAAREAENAADQKVLDDLQARLEELAATAANNKVIAEYQKWIDSMGSGSGPAGGVALAQSKVDVAGTFSAAAAGGLGAGSTVTDLLKGIKDGTDRIQPPVFG